MYDHNYTEMFQSVFDDLADDANTEYRKGISLDQIIPEIKNFSGILYNTTVSPFVADGWLYGGFSIENDLQGMKKARKFDHTRISYEFNLSNKT